mgnify:CR=1 FL=1
MLFWAVFKQNGTALTRWANYYTDRQVTGTSEKVLSSIYLVEQKDYKTKEVQKYDNQFKAEKDENDKLICKFGGQFYFSVRIFGWGLIAALSVMAGSFLF